MRTATYGKARSVDMILGLYLQNTRKKVNATYDMPSIHYMSNNNYTSTETLAAYSDLI